MPCPINVSMDYTEAAASIADAPIVSLDCETSGIHATARLVGLAIYVPNSETAFYLPVYSAIDPPASLVPEQLVANLVALVLNDPSRVMVAHNAAFELMIFRRLGIQARCQIWDTMLGYHRLDNTYRDTYDPDAGQWNYKLKTLTRVFLNAQQDTFDATTHGQPAQMIPASQMADYACQDVYYTTQHFLSQVGRLQAFPNLAAVLRERDFELLPVICEMLFGGIPIDPAVANQNIVEAKSKFRSFERDISVLIGRPTHLNRKDVVRRILVKDCGIAEASWMSLGERSLRRMRKEAIGARAAVARGFIDLIISRRKQADVLTKFFNPFLKRMNVATGLLHAGGFNMMTETGRLAAQNPNVQAMPKRGPVRQMIVAKSGEEIVAIDFSNIEPRVLAQALLKFVEVQDAPIKTLKTVNRDRAKELFGHLIDQRKFVRPYIEHPSLPYPATSALAECFAEKGGDPYVLVAQKMYQQVTIDKEMRDRAKGFLLATMYGQGLPGYVALKDSTDNVAADLYNRLSAALPEIGIPSYVNKHDRWVKVVPTSMTFREHVESMIRLSGEVEGLFGRRRKFPGLYQLRTAERALVVYEWRGRYYEWDVAPVQLWNYALHCYVYNVRDQKSGQVIATSTTTHSPLSIMHRPGLCYWPFRQLSYKFIRSVTVDGRTTQFLPLEDCHRQGFNAVIQMSAGDIFKRAMIDTHPVALKHGGRMFLSVHDELVFTIPTHSRDAFIEEAVEVMEQPPASWFTIPIKVEVKVGPNYDLKDVPAYVPPDPYANYSTDPGGNAAVYAGAYEQVHVTN